MLAPSPTVTPINTISSAFVTVGKLPPAASGATVKVVVDIAITVPCDLSGNITVSNKRTGCKVVVPDGFGAWSPNDASKYGSNTAGKPAIV